MHLIHVTKTEQTFYNEFITLNNGSFLQSTAWGSWLEQQGRSVLRFLVIEKYDDQTELKIEHIIGAAQYELRPLRPLPGMYAYCSRGPVFKNGVIMSQKKEAVVALQKFLLSKNPIFIRWEPETTIPIKGKSSAAIQPGSTIAVDLRAAEDMLLQNMHQKTRYNIRLAEKRGVIVTAVQAAQLSNEQVIACARLISHTAYRQHYHDHGFEYYKNLLQFFKQLPEAENQTTLTVYFATLKNQLAATAIMIDTATTRTYLFGGSHETYKKDMAPYALHWRAIVDAQQNKQITYDFWGASTPKGETPGFVRFKKNFGGTEIFYPQVIDSVQKSLWYTIYSALRKLNRLRR